MKIITLFDHFYPAYKAGGPVQSLANLTTEVATFADSRVLTSAFDLKCLQPLRDVKVNCWTTVSMPNGTPVNVWYDNSKTHLTSTIVDAAPDVVYLNGMFSLRYMVKPLFICKRHLKKTKVVICPRGMLQKGALAIKPLKKKGYLKILAASGLVDGVRWHATNEEECGDIKRVFGPTVDVMVAPNIPRAPIDKVLPTVKEQGQLKLVYLSLISEKKNLLQTIQLVAKASAGITLDIYGPVADAAYWEKCKKQIGYDSDRIYYKGDVKPEDVQQVLSRYDALVLLTKGENFGHALYESLSVGRPLITTHFTPWNGLSEKHAGWNVSVDEQVSLLRTLEEIASLDRKAFSRWCNGAYQLADTYYTGLNAGEIYKKLFTIT